MKTIKELINFGIINIDKPSGPTSFSVSDYVKKALKINKTSHMGTLDPKVTGVLPITLSRACRLSKYFINHDKTYIGILHTHKKQEATEIQKIINERFVGTIKQTPPNKSAVKKQERERKVYYWNILEEDEEKRNFLFETKVQGGTYIRKLCSDLGEIIKGAHMAELRRIKAGTFDESCLVNLYEFDAAVEEFRKGKEEKLRKIIFDAEEEIKKILPQVEIKKEFLRVLLTGKPILKNYLKGSLDEKGPFIATLDGKMVGIYLPEKSEEVIAKPEFVFN